MEVVSTHIHGDTAQIYVTMRDLTGGRVDAATDLFDSYSLHIPFDSAANCTQAAFDEKTNTAAFLITISTMNGKDIAPGKSKVTFSVREFLSRKVTEENIPIPLDLTSAVKAEDTYVLNSGYGIKYTVVGYSSVNGREPDSYTVLIPGDPICSAGEGMDITGIGYINDELHIQVMTRDKLTLDTHGDLRLTDAGGNNVFYDSISFAEDMNTGERTDYQEFIFDVSPDEIANYKLLGDYYSNRMNTKGNWKVTFPLTTGGEK